MKPDDPITQNTNREIRILGICWIIYGVVRLFDAVWLVSFSNTATVMFGALLARVRDPFAMMTDFHFIYAFIEALSVICGVLGIFAGWTLLAGQGFGRTLALIAAFLSLSAIPLGMTVGIYTLVVLLPWRAAHAPTAAFHRRTSDFRSDPSTT
jgi:hypothetical protein